MVFSRSEKEPQSSRRARRKNKNLSELRVLRVKKMTKPKFTMEFEKAISDMMLNLPNQSQI